MALKTLKTFKTLNTFENIDYDSDNESYHDEDDDQSTSSSSSSDNASYIDEEDDEVVDVDEDDELGKDVEEDMQEQDYDEEVSIVAGSELFGGSNDDDDGEYDDDDGKSITSSTSSTEEEDEQALQKLDAEINKNYLLDYHPESVIHNEEEVALMCKVVRDANNDIIDELHRTLPYLTKYEKARILGQRSKQINNGAKAFVEVPEKVIDGYLIANMELKAKRIPFIIRRPLPNGGCEYWHLRDLEIIDF